jgi:hypothetical protein
MLDKLLKKLGVQKYEELNEEEKQTFREWEESLSGRHITNEDYRKFLEMELEKAVINLTEINLSKEDEIFRKVEVKFIKKVLNFLDGPIIEKQLLEKQLESRL